MTGAGPQGPVLPDGGIGGLQLGGEEDGDPHGALPPRDRAAHTREQGGVRGRGHGAQRRGDGGSVGRVRSIHQPRRHHPQVHQGEQDAQARPVHPRGTHEGGHLRGRRHVHRIQLRRREARGTERRLRRRVRPRGRGVRAPPQGRRAQEEGGRAGRHAPRPRRGQRPSPGGQGRPVPHGRDGQEQEDGDHGKAADRDQPRRQPVHRPGRGRARAGRPLRRRGPHARHRVLHVPQPIAGVDALPHRRLRDEPRRVPHPRDGRPLPPRRPRGLARSDAHRADAAVQRRRGGAHPGTAGDGGGDRGGRGGAAAAERRGDPDVAAVRGPDAHPGEDRGGDGGEDVHFGGRRAGRGQAVPRREGQRTDAGEERGVHELRGLADPCWGCGKLDRVWCANRRVPSIHVSTSILPFDRV
ncbi:hypothetical protein ACHAWF_014109 [Thalassiosira exigua]